MMVLVPSFEADWQARMRSQFFTCQNAEQARILLVPPFHRVLLLQFYRADRKRLD